MDSKLKKGITIVFITNVINLIFSLVTNFILPKYLSVDSYAGIKTYQLYMSYVGLLHLGYVDGVYLKFGGVELQNKLDNHFSNDIWTMRILEGAIGILCLTVAFTLHDNILLCFSLGILPVNMSSYYKYLYQATGQFDRYGRIMNLSAFATFALNCCIVFILKLDNAEQIISLYAILYIVIWLLLEFRFKSIHKIEKPDRLFSISSLRENVGTGFFLTIGNLASLFLSSMDRWFVKFLLDTYSFAMYSFAVSVEGFLNIAITPITTTLYNYFCREKSIEKQKSVFEYLVVFSTVLPSAAFLLKFILEVFLQTYLDATSIIFILFGAKIFIVLVNSVFVNLYKVKRQQRRYFVKLLCILGLGFVLDTLFYYVLGNNEGFAIGTLISSFVWFVISYGDFRYLSIGWKPFIYIGICLCALIFLGCNFNSWIGLVGYLLALSISGLVFMQETYRKLFRICRSRIQSLTRR